MTVRNALIGPALGAAGLVLGVGAAIADLRWLAVVAGVAALAAGAWSLILRQQIDAEREALTIVEDELRTTRDQAAQAKKTAAPEDLVGSTPKEERPKARPLPPPRVSGPSRDEPLVADFIDSLGEGDEEPDGLVDAATGLFSESFFLVALDGRIAAARRHLRPVAMVLLEVVRGLPGEPGPVEADLVAETVKSTLREADTACRLQNGYFALLLEDTPENGAIWTVERIRRKLLTDHDGLTIWAGVACYPAHAFSPNELMDAAQTALVAAREWRQDRIEVATAAE